MRTEYSKNVYKYSVENSSVLQTVSMDITGNVLHVAGNLNVTNFWAEHHEHGIPIDRYFQTFSTGSPIPDYFTYRGTHIVSGIVIHLYEKTS